MTRSTRVRDMAGLSVFADAFVMSYTEAAEDLRRDRTGFAQNVKRSLSGGFVKNDTYDNVHARKA